MEIFLSRCEGKCDEKPPMDLNYKVVWSQKNSRLWIGVKAVLNVFLNHNTFFNLVQYKHKIREAPQKQKKILIVKTIQDV